MNVKKIKRKCAVKGCKNVETFTISKVRDFGDTVLICPSCLAEALKAVKNYGKVKPKTNIQPPPAVFYNHLTNPLAEPVDITPTQEDVPDDDVVDADDETDDIDETDGGEN